MGDAFDDWLAARPPETSPQDGELLPGTHVDEYLIVALLGRGGFAEVYRATDQSGGPVAIKILHRIDERSRARFGREARILSQLRHPNIPRLLGSGSCGNRPYLVTELLKPCDLPHDGRSTARFLRKIIAATDALHSLGFVHRDIKPANVLIRDDGEPVLIDFGLACPLSRERREAEGLSVEDGNPVAVGTPKYSAPEQFNGSASAGPEADVHAIGAMITDCLGARISGCWRSIYLSATNSSPDARYPTVKALGHAIRWRHARLVGVTGLVAAALAVVVWLPWPRTTEKEPAKPDAKPAIHFFGKTNLSHRLEHSLTNRTERTPDGQETGQSASAGF